MAQSGEKERKKHFQVQSLIVVGGGGSGVL